MKKIFLIMAIFMQVLIAQIATASIKTFTLSNNIKVLFEKTDGREIVSLKVFTPVSQISERRKNAGISYLVFKTMTISTLKRNKEKLSEDLDDIGASISGDAKPQYVYIGIDVLSQYFDNAAEILADIIKSPAFKKGEVNSVKRNVALDLSLRKDNITMQILDKFRQEFYKGSPYAYPIIGTRLTINSIKPQDLKRWHRYSYNSKNTLISVAGNIDENLLKESLEKHFSNIPSGMKFKNPNIKLSKSNGRRIIFKRKFHNSGLAMGYKSPDLHSKNLAAFDILTTILGDGLNGKLAKEIRVNLGLTYGINMFYSSMRQNNNAIILSIMDSKNINKSIVNINRILREISTNKIESAELERAKIKARADYLLENQTVDNKSFGNGWGEVIAGDFNYKERFFEDLMRVSEYDILKVAKKTFRQKPMIVIIKPTKARQ